MSQDNVIKLPQPGEVCSTPLGGIGFRDRGAIAVPFAARLDELAGGDHRGMTDDGDGFTLTARLHAQNAEAVVFVMECYSLDEAS